jgi:hypothetical protein
VKGQRIKDKGKRQTLRRLRFELGGKAIGKRIKTKGKI